MVLIVVMSEKVLYVASPDSLEKVLYVNKHHASTFQV